MARAGVNPPSGPPPTPPTRVPATRRNPPPPARRNWLPAVIIVVLAVALIGAVAAFVLSRSGDSDSGGSGFADACSIVDNVVITNAVGYGVNPGVAVATGPPLSGCTFAPADPAQPPIGVIVTDDAQNADAFDRKVLSDSYPSMETVRGVGGKAVFLSRDGAAPESTEALLVVTDDNTGVEISVAGLISANQAFDIARSVVELYADELGLG